MPLISGGLILAWWRGWLPRRVWVIAVLLHLTLTASAFAAMQTGEQDEHTATSVLADEHIRAHEESAELFLWSTVGALLLSLIGVVAEDEQQGRRFALGAWALSVGSVFLAWETGERGGELVYKYGAARAYTSPEYGGLKANSPDARGATGDTTGDTIK
jgi:hypothetical protein